MLVDALDEEWILSERQVLSLLDWIRQQAGGSRSVYPFLVTLAEGALRPSEARSLRVRDVVLHSGGSGELMAGYRRQARVVPLRLGFAMFLRGWFNDAGLQKDDLLFPGARGERLSVDAYMGLWEQAQEAVLPHDELLAWRLGEPVDILRESSLVRWLRLGVDVATVAELAGVAPAWLALRDPHWFRLEVTEIDWERLAQATRLPEATD
ncbi:site-specific integrase [Streptomyces sp. 7G]|uniref:tyrosine-type recombinase/integrase n=1 Tax=Streptomyces sp. 7G TaxID=2877241 RepID=UPI001CD3B8E6|nr:tyrosine-type recombinase/integrase [Streptomyces sp. 7G]MCA1269590.1 site-specific integrase [Streptomyces sp. 7G]